jgi:hypothetical protein
MSKLDRLNKKVRKVCKKATLDAVCSDLGSLCKSPKDGYVGQDSNDRAAIDRKELSLNAFIAEIYGWQVPSEPKPLK